MLGENLIPNAKAIGSIMKSKVKGKLADMKRGRILHKQGYGEYYESSLSIAKKGKTGQTPKRPRTR